MKNLRTYKIPWQVEKTFCIWFQKIIFKNIILHYYTFYKISFKKKHKYDSGICLWEKRTLRDENGDWKLLIVYRKCFTVSYEYE